MLKAKAGRSMSVVADLIAEPSQPNRIVNMFISDTSEDAPIYKSEQQVLSGGGDNAQEHASLLVRGNVRGARFSVVFGPPLTAPVV